MTTWEGWLAGAVLLQVLLVLLVYVWRAMRIADMRKQVAAVESALLARLQLVEKSLVREDARLDQLQLAVARIEAQVESMLKETNASRAAVRRVEDYLLQAKRRNHDESQF